jgi:hypothetical protein
LRTPPINVTKRHGRRLAITTYLRGNAGRTPALSTINSTDIGAHRAE